MAYVIYFDSDNVQYRLPVNPDEVSIEHGQEAKEYDILKLGKVSVPGNEELTKYSFDFELPSKPYSYVLTQNGFSPPETYLDIFKKHSKTKKPIRFVANNGLTSISVLVTIISLKQVEKAGEEGDYYCSISLKEYKPYSIKTAVTTTNTAVVNNVLARASVPPVPASNIHVVQTGDTLWALAKKYLGNGNRYTEIASLNNIKNASLISVGQKITIPKG